MADQGDRRDVVVAAFLVAVGIAGWLHWTITDPSFDVSAAQSEWDHVIGFSALILALASGSVVLGRAITSAASARRSTTVLFVSALLAALTNLVEDGLGVEQLFVVFAILTGVQLVALVALAATLARSVKGRRRALALAPVGSAVGVIAYVDAGGPILLVTWSAAAVVLLLTRSDATLGVGHG